MGESHKFSTGPQLSEYVQVVCRNTNGTCLRSVSQTPTFTIFQDFQPLKTLLHTSSQMANFGQFLAKMEKTGFFFKKAFGTFFSLLKALINCKVSEKSNEGIQRKKRKTSIFGHFGQKWPILEVFGQNGRNGIFFFKKALGTFFPPLQVKTIKFQKKVMNGFRDISERIRAKFKVLTN